MEKEVRPQQMEIGVGEGRMRLETEAGNGAECGSKTTKADGKDDMDIETPES